jgi:hypothetical protein
MPPSWWIDGEGFTANFELWNVTSTSLLAHEAAFEKAIAQKLNLPEATVHMVSVHGSTRLHADLVPSKDVEQDADSLFCQRIAIDQLAPYPVGAMVNGVRPVMPDDILANLGDYYVHGWWADKRVYKNTQPDVLDSKFVYYETGTEMWVVGPTVGSTMVNLILPGTFAQPVTHNQLGVSSSQHRWYGMLPGETWDAEGNQIRKWTPVPAMRSICKPVDVADVSVVVRMRTCPVRLNVSAPTPAPEDLGVLEPHPETPYVGAPQQHTPPHVETAQDEQEYKELRGAARRLLREVSTPPRAVEPAPSITMWGDWHEHQNNCGPARSELQKAVVATANFELPVLHLVLKGTKAQTCDPRIELHVAPPPANSTMLGAGAFNVRTRCSYDGSKLTLEHSGGHSFSCFHRYDEDLREWNCHCRSWVSKHAPPADGQVLVNAETAAPWLDEGHEGDSEAAAFDTTP